MTPNTDSPSGKSNFATLDRITFGMIVLNGEPFIRYNLRSIYPWAHEIIVVEGACKAAARVATVGGHSTDRTLDVLRRFQAEEDPDGKITIITAEDEGYSDGFWPGEKHEMSQAYAKRATGNYLWQVDVDEFYLEEDMPQIINLLRQGADAVSFPTYHFWGGIQFVEDGEYMRVHKAREYHRLFRWGVEYRYETHRPPTVTDPLKRNLREGRWITAGDLERKNIFMYHYSTLLPKQVREKCSYYSRVDWAPFQRVEQWARETYFTFKNPFRICHTLHVPVSWLDEYCGTHPQQVLKMMQDLRNHLYPSIELRGTEDIERTIQSSYYRVGRFMRRSWVKFLPLRNSVWKWLAQWKFLGRTRRKIYSLIGLHQPPV